MIKISSYEKLEEICDLNFDSVLSLEKNEETLKMILMNKSISLNMYHSYFLKLRLF